MPRINEYGVADQAQGGALEAFSVGSDSGKTMQRVGEAITSFGDANYRRRAQSEVSELNAKFADAHNDWAMKLEEDVRNGTVSTESARESYQKYVGDLNQNIHTSEGKEFFDNQSTRLGGYITKTAAHGQAIAAGNKAVTDFTDALNTRSNLLQRKPGDFQDAYDSSLEAITAQVNTGTISEKQGADLTTATGKELAKNAVRGLIKQNPSSAKQAIDAGQFDKYIDPDTKSALRDHADAEMKSRQDQFEKTLALKDKDPWQFLQKTGQAGSAKPISLGADAADSFSARAEFVDTMNKKNGIQLPFLSEHEADHITKQMMSKPPDEAIAAMNNIDTQVSDQNKSRFAMQVFKKEPALAAALMISGDSPDDARKILGGMNLLRSGGEGVGRAVEAPPPGESQSYFDAYVGSAIQDAGTRQAGREATVAHYVKSVFDQGRSNFKDIDQKQFNASARAVLGPTVEIGGQKAMSFRGKDGQFVNEDRFADLVDSLTDKRVEAIQGDVPRTMSGEPINLEKSRGRINLKSVGDGLYFVTRDSKPAMGKDRRPFVLDLKRIERGIIGPQQKEDFSDPSARGAAL